MYMYIYRRGLTSLAIPTGTKHQSVRNDIVQSDQQVKGEVIQQSTANGRCERCERCYQR